MPYRMTKAMRKDNDRIAAWLAGEEFKENARAKPAVPELDEVDVLETWTPPDVSGAGQFFTPFEAAAELWSYGYCNVPEGGRVLDPCAGIGHLFTGVEHEWWFDDPDVVVDAYEMEEVCVNLGRKLWPQVNWRWELPWDCLDDIQDRYDLVLMNPPFGTTRGMYGGRDEMCGGKVSRSEHVFLWLMALALKEDGMGLVILPYNTWDKVPKTAKPWFEERLTLKNTWGPLPGEFRHSKSMRVHGYIFRRTSHDVPQRAQEPGEAVEDEIDSNTYIVPDPPVSEAQGEPGTLLDPDTPKEVTINDATGQVTISVADTPDTFPDVPEPPAYDDGAVSVACMDGQVYVRVRYGSKMKRPQDYAVEPSAIRDGNGGIRGYLPMVKRAGVVTICALQGGGGYPYADEIHAWLRPTPEEAMQLWRSGKFVYDNETSVWTDEDKLPRAFLRKLKGD